TRSYGDWSSDVCFFRSLELQVISITEPLLKITCNSSPSSLIASITTTSFGSTVAMIAWPTESGLILELFNISTSAVEAGSQSGRSEERRVGKERRERVE